MIEKVTLRLEGERFVPAEELRCDELAPKALMLYAGVKCAALSALHIMRRERVAPERFEISMAGEIGEATVQEPSVFTSFHVVYNVECDTDDDQVKVSRAIKLAHEKYCGMVRMLSRIAPVTYEIAVVSTEPERV